ncbi:tol-pal system protein YbgF [Blochmannia endosymbiont of Colobopsis nipponica]|uniref:tol-pal system protein YbgF n=1 Tax=Blochmannia endosymbiont of Colobopsis nipponica TaxID=2681987 RepID=UPI0017812ACB|nr:tol-pal system protein YbgF [Blochmannia endosymbiont of Colobopsis nipponica]QOI11104.1 tol-pal system protein YbgF [Blochmannia endosymbiont of Colobopsis nipponica]
MSYDFLLRILILSFSVMHWCSVAKVSVKKINIPSVDEKVFQIERICIAHSQCLVELQQQLLNNQEEINLLRGQIQENQYQLKLIVGKQNNIFQQINKLINDIDKSSIPSHKKESPTQKEQTKSIINSNNKSIHDAYHAALSLVIRQKQHDKAIIAFQNFLQNYPNSIYSPNVHYWLGQLNYNKGKQEDASYYFAIIAKKYPKSSKAPDALLKLGIIMQNKGQKDKAKAIYQRINKLYPHSDAAKQIQKHLTQL